MTRRFDVAVAGAGPSGAALAAALARRGASVLLVEAAEHPRPKACAEYASPRIADELARLGIRATAWQPAARRLDGMDLHAGGHRVRIAAADARGPRPAWGLDRRRFDAILAAHASACGATLQERSRIVGLVTEGTRVRGVRVRRQGSDESVRADIVVGADGARSTVARLLDVEAPVRAPRRLGLVAHYEPLDDLVDHGEMHAATGWYVGLAPIAGALNVGMALPMSPARPAEARFAEAVAALPAVARRLAASRRIGPIRGAAPIGHRVREVAGSGWLLVGDAAGFVDPFTGEGIHRALRGARAAADAILAGGDVAAAYRRERQRAFAAKEVLSWIVQAALAAPGVLGHAVGRLESRPVAARRLGSALGDCRPAADALSPRAVWEVLGP
ncbi:MAG TPA: NAD(P)/FAD-dependent oxidoreductase [Candidatus Angelobacter sp.]|nr:NAD(P)/FAD-dependent oxidoreductase [Candidatus Angelobacter sp.]